MHELSHKSFILVDLLLFNVEVKFLMWKLRLKAVERSKNETLKSFVSESWKNMSGSSETVGK